MDEKNVFTLGNLAAIQLERGRMEDAEANLKKALALEPNDPFNLSLWGILKFRQAKYNEAFDALSLAVKFDPKNPETQNYLGITLSQKGQRQAAESALREAIRLSPDYASAHYNLAVVYATQKPPFLELARYHYRKALSSGHGRNAEFEKVIEGKK
jgi:Flp pilus assembly protein TadD